MDAPRVRPLDIETSIESEHYFTAADGAAHASGGYVEEVRAGIPQPLHLLTICVLVLDNGFTVIGESACASPENFSAETGRENARKKAVDKVWPLLGFRLRDRLAERG